MHVISSLIYIKKFGGDILHIPRIIQMQKIKEITKATYIVIAAEEHEYNTNCWR